MSILRGNQIRMASRYNKKKRRDYLPPLAWFGEEPVLSSALLAATLLTATLFFTLTLLTFTLLFVAILLLSALLSGGVGFPGFVWILLCVHGAFLYF